MVDEIRVEFAFKYATGKSFIAISRDGWERLVDAGGGVVAFGSTPPELACINSMPSHVNTAGSGIDNSNPGISVITYSQTRDGSSKYKEYHYRAIEHFRESKYYTPFVAAMGNGAKGGIEEYVDSHVFFLGPYKEKGKHHFDENPEHIKNAKKKEETE